MEAHERAIRGISARTDLHMKDLRRKELEEQHRRIKPHPDETQYIRDKEDDCA
jgi:hypothetical protein